MNQSGCSTNSQVVWPKLVDHYKDRGGFRIHPLGPDGKGESHGCITFFNIPDFNRFRQAIIQRKKFKIPGSRKGILAYGRVDVTGTANYEACDV
ncbi:tlde1 domain-containing protein [Serratia ficaria]|uniref:tlde1 domain-containing protein n=1 Tax=Serratia ficaria TaxID=61651 RepID=UPI0037037BE9